MGMDVQVRGVSAGQAVEDLGRLPVMLMSALPLRRRAWELRASLTTGEALFLALSERLGEPLATKDRGLARAARRHSAVEVLELG